MAGLPTDLFHYFSDLNEFDKAKKIKSRANSGDIADQVTERKNDNTLGIPRANLELKHWSSVHNFFQFGAIIDY